MHITGRYMDAYTGGLLAIRVTSDNGIYSVPMSIQVANQYCADDMSIIQYLEVANIPVVTYGGRLFLVENAIEQNINMPNRVEGSFIWVSGYRFDKYSGFVVDSQEAIMRAVRGYEM